MTHDTHPFMEAVRGQDWLGAHHVMIELLLKDFENIEALRERNDTAREIRLWLASAQKTAEARPPSDGDEPTLDEHFRGMVEGL